MSVIASENTADEYTRLHVTPFRPDLLNIYLGPSLAPLARNISYHTVQTFTEKGFGYLELPTMEAAKLKKKLNGSILKGHKIRLEEAKPEKRKRDSDEGGEEEYKDKKKSKKVKPQDGVLPGYELEEGRKVKRGWTETPAERRKAKESKKDKKKEKSEKKDKKDKKGREASKYTAGSECLFRTTLPSNVEAQQSEDKKGKKDKKKGKREVVIHEFSHSKKHSSFLKSGQVKIDGKMTENYVEGKGWVDADGNVVEEETEKQREKRERQERKQRKKAEKEAALEMAQSGEDEGHEPTEENGTTKLEQESSPMHGTEDPDEAVEEPDIANDHLPEPSKAVHPLEALYKRPQLPALDTIQDLAPKQSAFSFFGGDNDSDIDEDMQDAKADGGQHRDTSTDMVPPQTPFTKQDMEWRGLRSAAPTPDTAAIDRRFSFSFMGHIPEDDEDDEDDEDEDVTPSRTGEVDADAMGGLGITNGVTSKTDVDEQDQDGEMRNESEFAKWFYDHRSENNKKWRARRKEAMKLKRKRENRRLTRRIV